MQWRGVRRLSVRPSVCPSVNFCANRFFSHTNGRIATKFAHDELQVSLHPGCAQGQGQGQRSRDTRTFLHSWNELLRHWRSSLVYDMLWRLAVKRYPSKVTEVPAVCQWARYYQGHFSLRHTLSGVFRNVKRGVHFRWLTPLLLSLFFLAFSLFFSPSKEEQGTRIRVR